MNSNTKAKRKKLDQNSRKLIKAKLFQDLGCRLALLTNN